jgi:pyruvate,orthophosphate dikinase
MSEYGLAVPPGFTITTECCSRYCDDWQQALPNTLMQQIVDSLTAVEEEMNSKFGSPENPLLLSVRSGAAISMVSCVLCCGEPNCKSVAFLVLPTNFSIVY